MIGWLQKLHGRGYGGGQLFISWKPGSEVKVGARGKNMHFQVTALLIYLQPGAIV